MRAMLLAIAAVVALALVAVGAAYLALPALVAPTGHAPASLPSLSAGALATALRAGPGGTTALTLSADEVDALLQGVGGGGGSGPGGGIASAWVTFGAGEVDLHADGLLPQLPRGIPGSGRVSGRPFGLTLQFAPTLGADGLLRLRIDRVAVGRLDVGGLVGVPRLLRFMVRAAGGTHPWWRVSGAEIVVDPATMPPIAAGGFGILVHPSALSVAAGGLSLAGTVQVRLQLDQQTLNEALDGALAARGEVVVPLVQLLPDRAVVTLVGPGETTASGAPIFLSVSPSIARPGILSLAVLGNGPDPPGAAAILLGEAVGSSPAWLTEGSGGLAVDWSQVAPIQVAPGLSLHFLPVSVQVVAGSLDAVAEVWPGA